ncbi:MAG TPA: Na(+)-translocating NADH-quinone reductase subunit C, partial [Spongiibacteraceae bacterium]|nr:Na(+)-translocating NADH-quinone reductase subunit C [Spongiibacteraceae bacterium]
MANNDTIKKTVIVALALCIVCSLVVSTAAVLLKPAQEVNKSLDRKRNILAAAGLLEAGVSVEEQFKQVQPRLVDLDSGTFIDEPPAQYDPNQAARDPDTSIKLDRKADIAGLGRRENIAEVYLIQRDGKLDKVILPVRGYGLWSTLYGFLALDSDLNTVVGLGFYEHAETPGLGGEVDNPRWKAQWPGKKIYEDGEVAIELLKGTVDPKSPDAEHQVDGLAGATLTSRGVTHLMQFWLGDMGYKTFLN